MFLVVLILPLFLGGLAIVGFSAAISFRILMSLYYMIGWPLIKLVFSLLWKGIKLPFRFLIPQFKA